jgi:hypothetical protein
MARVKVLATEAALRLRAMAAKKDIVNVRVRMIEALRKKLAAEAKANERSLNSEIVYRLGQSLGTEGAEMVKMHESVEQRLMRMFEEIVAKMQVEQKL